MNSPLASFKKSETVSAEFSERLISVAIYDENVILTFQRSITLPDGKHVSMGSFYVTRLIEEIPQELIDAVAKIASLSEQWKAEDVAKEAENAAARAAMAKP